MHVTSDGATTCCLHLVPVRRLMMHVFELAFPSVQVSCVPAYYAMDCDAQFGLFSMLKMNATVLAAVILQRLALCVLCSL